MSYGFSLLAWVDPDSPLLMGLDPRTEAHSDMQKTILHDVQALWGIRWGIDMTMITIQDQIFIHGNNSRFHVSNDTIRKALGDLAEHIKWIRSTPNIGPEDLVKYKEALKKWNVETETQDTSSTSGTVQRERPGTSRDSRYRPY